MLSKPAAHTTLKHTVPVCTLQGTHTASISKVNPVRFFISVFNQLDAQNLFHNKFYFMPLDVSSTCVRNM